MVGLSPKTELLTCFNEQAADVTEWVGAQVCTLDFDAAPQ